MHLAERFLDYQIERMHDHLPSSTRRLSDLLREAEPHYLAKSGERVSMDKKELEEISGYIPSRYHGSLFLPIILTRRLEMGRGAFTVSGGRLEEYLAERILGRFLGSVEQYLGADRGDLVYVLYKPEVAVIITRFKSVFALAFPSGPEPWERAS